MAKRRSRAAVLRRMGLYLRAGVSDWDSAVKPSVAGGHWHHAQRVTEAMARMARSIGAQRIEGMNSKKDQIDEILDNIGYFEPMLTTCSRCGKAGMTNQFFADECDEWECQECYERCEATARKQTP